MDKSPCFVCEVDGQNCTTLHPVRLLWEGQKILIDCSMFGKEINFLYQEGFLLLPRSNDWLLYGHAININSYLNWVRQDRRKHPWLGVDMNVSPLALCWSRHSMTQHKVFYLHWQYLMLCLTSKIHRSPLRSHVAQQIWWTERGFSICNWWNGVWTSS